ncbi:oxygenase MpaB family protein [Spelaeicoccus albus]|uniref:Uncharacterized protein (DUF2236 family) n=1 Tax=Spelaeicoccus albus TaxID=1280376 RepID=A0A7Z0ABX9_9MICO|nr:oxygenase MpaB family protein [Spelaeicoccus albus]NYI67381.1 uncharacterized protein (DUF2236 family) [Spelaeicoccus albus]
MTFAGQVEEVPEWERRLADGRDEGYFAPDSAVWAVHGGMASIVAGVRSLLMQALHPGAMAGVYDWSDYRSDPLARLAGTIRWIFTVTYGDTAAANEATEFVRRIHDRVHGRYVDAHGVSRPYSANDQELLEWVHLAFTDSFLAAHRRWGGEIPGGENAYVRQWAISAELMGVAGPPRSMRELRADMDAVYDAGDLCADDRVAEVVHFLKHPPLAKALRPGYQAVFAGAAASIEPKYRRMLGLSVPLEPVATCAAGSALKAVGRALGPQGPSELAARERLTRLAIKRQNAS